MLSQEQKSREEIQKETANLADENLIAIAFETASEIEWAQNEKYLNYLNLQLDVYKKELLKRLRGNS